MICIHLVRVKASGECCVVEFLENLFCNVRSLVIGRKLNIIIDMLKVDDNYLGGVN